MTIAGTLAPVAGLRDLVLNHGQQLRNIEAGELMILNHGRSVSAARSPVPVETYVRIFCTGGRG